MHNSMKTPNMNSSKVELGLCMQISNILNQLQTVTLNATEVAVATSVSRRGTRRRRKIKIIRVMTRMRKIAEVKNKKNNK